MKILSIIALLFVASPSFANTTADCAAKAPRGQEWKECKNTVRENETVSQYLLTKSGNLFSIPKNSKSLCQVTDNVKDFKISQHKNDAAMIYFKREGDLSVLHREGLEAFGACPKTSKKVIMPNVKKFSVTSNTDTTIVNVALDNNGKLVAWDNTKPVYTDLGVADYQMNECFGVRGKSFSSYVMFSSDFAGLITKVKGKKSGDWFEYIADKTTSSRYSSLGEFKSREKVCK